MTTEIETVKNLVREECNRSGISLLDIFLFGSRARGNQGKDSDWDFLVVIDKDLGFNDKWSLILKLKRRLAKLGIPNDIVIKSRDQLEAQKTDVGHIAYYALREGVRV